MAWIRAGALADFRDKPAVLNHAPLQIAVFRVGERIFAIDNRCPHEGYPLAAGTVSSSCVLTCNWHNWKFSLEDGACVVGGDSVHCYPTRLEGGEIWVDISPPPPEETRHKILSGLRTAFDERDHERICREIARLHFNGFDPLDAVRSALEWFHNRREFGTSHVFAGTADWLSLSKSFEGDFEKELVCFSEAVDHMASEALRQPEFPYPINGEPFDRGAFLSAVESQDAPRVEGMVARALAEGLHWADLEEPFAAAAFMHYNSGGHSVIYVQKAGELFSLLGMDVERLVLLPLARGLCFTVREDLVPEFKDYASTLHQLSELTTMPPLVPPITVPFPCTVNRAFGWLLQNLKIHTPVEVYEALLTGLACNMLHYDTAYEGAFDRPVSSNVSWLNFTHGITFSNAARDLCVKYPHLWRPALLQMVCFLGRNHRYLDEDVDVGAWCVRDAREFFAATHEELLDHGIDAPVFAVHLLKTAFAVEAELPFATPQCRDALLASLNRYLHSPMKMKHSRRLARQAIALVSRDFAG